jgi:thioredoxin reductase/NAD-dependent dihydropyrimidine dehydrogenase PreA subunit
MTTTLVVAALLGVSLLLYVLWERADRKKEEVALGVIEDTAAMGDVIPVSLHPEVDPSRCMGSGACVAACPEKVVIALVGGRARLANPLGCIGHGACEAACPVGAIKLVYGSKTRGVELPRVDPHFQTGKHGVYVVGELGGMGLIRNATNQGRQAAAHIVTGNPEAEQPPRRGVDGAFDALVVGAGPAGISTTLALMEAGLNVLLMERERFGGTIMHYPRAKVVMTDVLDLPLYGKLKQTKMSKEQLVAVWDDIRAKLSPPLVTGELVERLELGPDGMWHVHSDTQMRRAANVVLALGVRGSPRKLEVPGEELSKVAYRLLEPAEYAGRHVLVVGGGNSAVESALALLDHGGCASVSISYRGSVFARCRGDNRRRIEDALAAGQVRSLLGTELRHIAHDHVVLTGAQGQSHELPNDAVIVQVGGTPPAALLKSFGVEIITKYGEA